ncbi:MAG: GNAT family N-acetyltransferase [Candidatus Bathyarchaeota archaeon]|nr:GNAT family N-acetyltransferase [Candidatus Bathyarchaeota archaeon]
MIRRLLAEDFQAIYNIIDDASEAYRGKIPLDCWKTPYMPAEELQGEIDSGVKFYGYLDGGVLVAVMGIQEVGDVTLIRHAYTLTSHQRRGIGEKLLSYLLDLAQTRRILVGTWTDAIWAIGFYQKHGFRLLGREETNKLLRTYWNIPWRQIETSVVLDRWQMK